MILSACSDIAASVMEDKRGSEERGRSEERDGGDEEDGGYGVSGVIVSPDSAFISAATKGLGERKASDSTEGKDHDDHRKTLFPQTSV
ncbi:hypothetical protein HA466_0140370 [Hirschfeldia incana]|nr:hypothetical protein HA466_0140370 [Hirschfeldia incana]